MVRHRSDRSLEELIRATAHGDVEAFTGVFENAVGRVHGLAFRVLRDEHHAEEVTQEVFLHVWRSAGQFDPARGSAQAWLMMLAHRRAGDRVRSSERARRREAADARFGAGTPYDETAASVDRSLEAARVRTALSLLPAGQRRALELAYFDGHTHVEVARLLEVPLGTTKSRIRDGLRRLRDLLRAELPEPA
jgi:RNA polymerase sigma-70 factor (ECF subfamily)